MVITINGGVLPGPRPAHKTTVLEPDGAEVEGLQWIDTFVGAMGGHGYARSATGCTVVLPDYAPDKLGERMLITATPDDAAVQRAMWRATVMDLAHVAMEQLRRAKYEAYLNANAGTHAALAHAAGDVAEAIDRLSKDVAIG